MVSYDYTIAKENTSEAEKERILAIFLNTHNGVTDWEKATKDYGSASVASMKVSLANMYKKIEKAGGKLAEDGNATQIASAAPATPASKKRKAKGEVLGEEGETPKAKKGGRPKKVVKSEVVDEEEEVVVEEGLGEGKEAGETAAADDDPVI